MRASQSPKHNQPLLSRKTNQAKSPLVKENVKRSRANYSSDRFLIHFASPPSLASESLSSGVGEWQQYTHLSSDCCFFAKKNNTAFVHFGRKPAQIMLVLRCQFLPPSSSVCCAFLGNIYQFQ